MTFTRLGLAVLVGTSCLMGCATAGEPAATDAAKPQKEATAWWKNEGMGTAAANAAAEQAPAKAGWAKLAAVDSGLAAKGEKLFDNKGCVSCHTIGKGAVVGPDLKGLTARVEPEWLEKWLQNPDPMLESDPYAKEMLVKYLVKMPNLNLTPDEIKALTEYMRQQDAAAVAKK
jgi:cytochrome c551/c552